MANLALKSRRGPKPLALFAGPIAALVFGAISSAQATIIDFDLGKSSRLTSKIDNSFDVLDGMRLQGQTLSLDITFSSHEFVRLFTITSNPFVALLKLQTTDSGS